MNFFKKDNKLFPAIQPFDSGFIKKGLEEETYAVDVATDGEEGLLLGEQNQYDLIILDLMLPKIDGLEVLSTLRDQKIETPILLLTAKDSVEDKVNGLNLGADDYLTKPFSFTELLARVQALIRRSSHTTEPTRLECGDLRMDLLTRDVFIGEIKVELQPKEFSLLEYLIRQQGRVVTKTMILEHIWNYHFDPQTNVVDVLVSRLRNKVDPEKKRIHTMRGIGYVLKPH